MHEFHHAYAESSLKNLLVLIYSKLHSKTCDYLVHKYGEQDLDSC